MKISISESHLRKTIKWLFIFGFLIISTVSYAKVQSFEQIQQDSITFQQYRGKVVDVNLNKKLVFASLLISGTNVSTITNSDGEFLLKVPSTLKNTKVVVSFLGYHSREIALSSLKNTKNTIALAPATTKLSEVIFTLPKDAKSLVRKTFKKKGENTLDKHLLMTAFYRETIKKRNKNVSLAEAIVYIYKQPYTSLRKDDIKLYKSRKNTDYSRLDTIAVKLQGGPYNALYVDLMKYPEYLFTDNAFDYYTYSFAQSVSINDKPVYVVKFKQHSYIEEPLYYGTLYIDAESFALTSAIFNLNVENKERASKLFVKKKPKDIVVTPLNISYRVDYREKNGKWYYGYSNAQLSFKINKKRKLFNSIYSLTSEMAVTDWKYNPQKEVLKNKSRMSKSIIISDEASGFSDPAFWGAYNVIEPEKSIESAINKIKKQLQKI